MVGAQAMALDSVNRLRVTFVCSLFFDMQLWAAENVIRHKEDSLLTFSHRIRFFGYSCLL